MARGVVSGQISLFDVPPSASASPPSEPILKPLTLEQVNGLDMCRSQVWIETKPWPMKEPNEVCEFFLLFPALFVSIGIPIGSNRRHYHFRYTYNRHKYGYYRVDEFYGSEWRVWMEKPTDAQREAEPWEE